MKYYKLLRFPDFKLKALTLSYDRGEEHESNKGVHSRAIKTR